MKDQILRYGILEIKDENPEKIPWRYSEENGYQYFSFVEKKWLQLFITI